jgi:K+-sensing histidine kinase KdpD
LAIVLLLAGCSGHASSKALTAQDQQRCGILYASLGHPIRTPLSEVQKRAVALESATDPAVRVDAEMVVEALNHHHDDTVPLDHLLAACRLGPMPT